MKIVIAPDSYKESLSALEVAQAVEAGFRQVFPDADYGQRLQYLYHQYSKGYCPYHKAHTLR